MQLSRRTSANKHAHGGRGCLARRDVAAVATGVGQSARPRCRRPEDGWLHGGPRASMTRGSVHLYGAAAPDTRLGGAGLASGSDRPWSCVRSTISLTSGHSRPTLLLAEALTRPRDPACRPGRAVRRLSLTVPTIPPMTGRGGCTRLDVVLKPVVSKSTPSSCMPARSAHRPQRTAPLTRPGSGGRRS